MASDPASDPNPLTDASTPASSLAAGRPSNTGPAGDPVDTLNPSSIAAAPKLPTYSSVEPLWFNLGKWGAAGYAIPNLAGKTWTQNNVIFQFFSDMGETMFALMHREAVQFERPPDKQWLYDLHSSIQIARKRLRDQMKADNDSTGLTVKKAAPSPQQLLVWPIPFFGGRVRQSDILSYAEIMMMLLSEIAQHADNQQTGYITSTFVAMADAYLLQIYVQMAMRFFQYTRGQAYADGFILKDTDFQAYDRSKSSLPIEITEDRPPRQWWPAPIDLVVIQGLPIAQAQLHSQRWPTMEWLDSGDPTLWPGLAAQQAQGNGSSSGAAVAAPQGAAGLAPVKPPGLAP